MTLSDDTRAAQPDHPLQKLIDFGVNDDETWSDFIEGLLASCLLRGNALAEVLTNNRGRLRGLTTLPWPQITPYVDDNGVLLFDFIPKGRIGRPCGRCGRLEERAPIALASVQLRQVDFRNTLGTPLRDDDEQQAQERPGL